MKLLILSFQKEHFDHRCNCCSADFTASEFNIWSADSMEDAAEMIGSRLADAPHSDHLHVIMEKFHGEWNYFGEEAKEIKLKNPQIPGSKFVPGNLIWLNQYDMNKNPGEHYTEQERICQLEPALVDLIEQAYYRRIEAVKEATRVREEVKKQKDIDDQQKRNEQEYARLGKLLNKS